MPEDLRKQKMLKTAALHFGLPLSEEKLNNAQQQATNKFLDDSNCSILEVSKVDTKGHLEFTNKLNSESKRSSIVFFKTKQEPISADNYDNTVMVLSVHGSAVNSLYQAVQKVYGPALVKNPTAKGLDPKLQKLITELEAGLGTTVRRQLGHSQSSPTVQNLAGILSPTDEIEYWAEQASKRASDTSERYYQILQPLAKDYADLNRLSYEELAELLEVTQDALDELWTLDAADAYPEERMVKLLDVISNAVCQFVQWKMDGVDVWSGSDGADQLRAATALCDQWASATAVLTAQMWKRSPVHPWKGHPFKSDYLAGFLNRVAEVTAIRSVTEQLARLLDDRSVAYPKTGPAAKSFAGINALHYNPYTESEWQSRVQQFERAVQPFAQRVMPQLKTKLRERDISPQQMLKQFSQYKELIKRPVVKQELISERYIKSNIYENDQKSIAELENNVKKQSVESHRDDETL